MRDKMDIRPHTVTKMALAAGLLLLILTLVSPASAYSPAAVSVAASGSTSAVLLEDGTVWQWGSFLGNTWRVPAQIDIAGVRQVAVGNGHVLALKSDGTVWAWGSNANGQLGDGTYNDSAEPVKADIDGVAAIAAGKDHSLALKGDGTVWAWGSNSYGQIGGGSRNATGSAVPVLVSGLYDIKAIASGGSHCFALQGNGTVWAWGDNAHGILGDGTNETRFTPAKSKLGEFKGLDAGTTHALAAKADGTVWAWGYNYMGQLGAGGSSLRNQGRTSYGPEADNYNPDIVRGITGVKAVAAGGSHSVALKSDGTVWAWGGNDDGQLGQGTTGGNDRTSPGQVSGIEGATAIAAGTYHTLAIGSDGAVRAWGSNEYGQVGNNSVSSSTALPVLVLMDSQIPPPSTPTPVIAASPTVTATPAPGGFNFLLAGAICLLAVIIIAVAAAVYLLAFRMRGKGKK